MYIQNDQPGLYLATAPIFGGLLSHTGIVDVGNRLHLENGTNGPMVVHQPSSGLRREPVQKTGLPWTGVHRIENEALAIRRINDAWHAATPYDALLNNCEHFTEFVVNGVRRSPQLKVIGKTVGVAALLVLAIGSMKRAK